MFCSLGCFLALVLMRIELCFLLEMCYIKMALGIISSLSVNIPAEMSNPPTSKGKDLNFWQKHQSESVSVNRNSTASSPPVKKDTLCTTACEELKPNKVTSNEYGPHIWIFCLNWIWQMFFFIYFDCLTLFYVLILLHIIKQYIKSQLINKFIWFVPNSEQDQGRSSIGQKNAGHPTIFKHHFLHIKADTFIVKD